MNVIGRRTVHLADLGPRSVSVCGPGRPKFIIAEELLENLRNFESNQIKSNQIKSNQIKSKFICHRKYNDISYITNEITFKL